MEDFKKPFSPAQKILLSKENKIQKLKCIFDKRRMVRKENVKPGIKIYLKNCAINKKKYKMKFNMKIPVNTSRKF